MRKRLFGSAFAIILGSLLIFAMSTSLAATEIDGIAITNADINQLLTAMHTALKPNDDTMPISVTIKSPGYMPAYSKDWYYAGIKEPKPGVREMHVWVSSDLKGDDAQHALAASFLLALADGGYGGKAFKQLYDACAARDAQLPPGAANPFVNRSQLATKLVDILLNQ